MKAECGNCGQIWDETDLAEIKDYFQRVEAGGEVPAGECPECGALCYVCRNETANGQLV